MTPGAVLGILDNLTGGEIIIGLVVALVVLGPERLPETARSMGRWIAKLKNMSSGLTGEIREVLDDPEMAPLREAGEFIASPRRKLMEYATEAENEAAEARKLAKAAAAAAEAAEAAAVAARANAQEAAELAEEEGLVVPDSDADTAGADTSDADASDVDTNDVDTADADTVASSDDEADLADSDDNVDDSDDTARGESVQEPEPTP